MNRPRVVRNRHITLLHSLLLTYRWTRNRDRFNRHMRNRHEMWIVIPRRIPSYPRFPLYLSLVLCVAFAMCTSVVASAWMENPTLGWSLGVLSCVRSRAPSSHFGIGDREYTTFVITFVPVRWATLIHKRGERLRVFLLNNDPTFNSNAFKSFYV